MKRIRLIASSLIFSALLSGCNSNAASSKSSVPSSEIINSIDKLAEESIGEAETVFDETKNEVLITKTASKGSALKIKRTKSDYGPVWEDKTDDYKSVSQSAYDFVQAKDYSVSCRIKIFSDEDADFALFEAVNGKVVYNAINDSSFASDAVTEKQAYSMAVEYVNSQVKREYKEMRYNHVEDYKITEKDDGFDLVFSGTASGTAWDGSMYRFWKLNAHINFDGSWGKKDLKIEQPEIKSGGETANAINDWLNKL